MRRHDDRADFGVALAMIRLLRGWSQAEIAKASGLSVGTISRYESGARVPGRYTVDKIAAAAGISLPLVDSLLDWIRAAKAALRGTSAAFPYPSGLPGPADTVAKERTRDMNRALEELLGSFSNSSPLWPRDRERRPEPPTETPTADRGEARLLWPRLEPLEADDRVLLVDEGTEYQSWALCELVCDKSLAAADRPREALELAELAVFIAERVDGREAWKQRLQGYASAHLGHARRAAGNSPGAEKAFARARRLWEAGASADPGILNETRLRMLDPDLSQRAP